MSARWRVSDHAAARWVERVGVTGGMMLWLGRARKPNAKQRRLIARVSVSPKGGVSHLVAKVDGVGLVAFVVHGKDVVTVVVVDS